MIDNKLMIQLIACIVYTSSFKENELSYQSEVFMGWLQVQGAGFTTSVNRLSISRKFELKLKKNDIWKRISRQK